jgi:hypothetical protein
VQEERGQSSSGSLHLRPRLIDELDVMMARLTKLAYTLQDARHGALVHATMLPRHVLEPDGVKLSVTKDAGTPSDAATDSAS